MKKVFDISPEISPEIGVFPGDVPFGRKVSLDLKNGDNLTLSSIQSTLHVGAHADAPSHYCLSGRGIASVSLDKYMGDVQVQEITSDGPRVLFQDFVGKPLAKKILLKTNSFPNPNEWNENFQGIDPKLIEFFGEHGVELVGIDTPSVDPQNDKLLSAHNVIAKFNMAILEGIILADIPDGIYELIALPLKIKEADASPVRAILLEK